MKFCGVREFKQDAVRYLNEGNEIVVMKRKKPIARLTPIQENTPEALLLDIGRILNEAGVTKEEALRRWRRPGGKSMARVSSMQRDDLRRLRRETPGGSWKGLQEHDVFISESIQGELEGVLQRLSRKLSPEQIRSLQEKVFQLLKVAKRIPLSTHLSLSRDAKDDHY